MDGITSSLAKPMQMRRDGKPRPRSEAKRARIVEAAIRHFAERGYSAARVEDIAAQLGIAKGSVFQHFKSKDGLFSRRTRRRSSRFRNICRPRRQRGSGDFLNCCGTG